MHVSVPADCFLSLPVEITPELARSRADKMNLLLQVQLLSRSISDGDSALRLLLDLARDLVPYDRALLLWRREAGGPFEVQGQRGGEPASTGEKLREHFLSEAFLDSPRTLLVAPATCAGSPADDLLAELGATSLLGMPLYVGEHVRGVLYLVRDGLPPYSREDAHLTRVFTFTFETILDQLAQDWNKPEVAFLDGLTGLFTRRYFEQQLEREMDRARRNNEPVSILLLDVDQFAAFRAAFGQATADALLQEVARALCSVCRKSDTVSRHEGDRFAVILPRTGKEALGVAAQRVFQAIEGPFLAGLLGEAGQQVAFNLCGVAYPDDAFSPESALEACQEGLERARKMPGRHYFQYPSTTSGSGSDEILDMSRIGSFREPLLEPTRLLRLFARLCLDTVPADRVSIMLRDGEELVIQVAFGFNGQEELVRSARIPLGKRSVSSWVAQSREPLLVRGRTEVGDLPVLGSAAYRDSSFFSYPLLAGGELVGLIHFSNRSDGNPFTDQDLERFAPLAEVISRHLATSRDFSSVREDFLNESLASLVELMESQVPGMAGHSQEVARLATGMARELGYDAEQLERIRVSSLLHDLGKISYRSDLLAEPRALSARERALTQRHPLLGWKLLEEVPLHRVDREAILYHHEREDGSGYLHKASADTPENAKLLAVADVYQALVSPRPYRPAVSAEEALRYLQDHKGELFDTRAVTALATYLQAPGGASA